MLVQAVTVEVEKPMARCSRRAMRMRDESALNA